MNSHSHGEDENGVRFDLCNSASPSFPHVFSGNPGGIRTGPPIKAFEVDDFDAFLLNRALFSRKPRAHELKE